MASPPLIDRSRAPANWAGISINRKPCDAPLY